MNGVSLSGKIFFVQTFLHALMIFSLRFCTLLELFLSLQQDFIPIMLSIQINLHSSGCSIFKLHRHNTILKLI